MSERVTEAEAAGVAPRERCAWGAVCAEAVTRLYSPHFQQVFRTEEAFSLVWGYIAAETLDPPALLFPSRPNPGRVFLH